LKLETEQEVTTTSGSAFQILITRLVKKFLSRSEATASLANLSELPRVEGHKERLKKDEVLTSTKPFNIL
jgi:hypothetical protein